ncbi:YcaO-like family protein [Actinomadura terrae]|uniref:YcaO-like family protein n=1 Tax=Actinomadura terrae TaxID=604353 RepID=UPI001FA7AB82|nr:YcaO-like family protein [Actinomadura terrae]
MKRPIVQVEGDTPLGALVAGLLEPAAEVVRGTLDRALLSEIDLVICCAVRLPDARWQKIDRWCAEAGVPWHRCHAEGGRFYIGPFTASDSRDGDRSGDGAPTTTYLDSRTRRLAAARSPEQLMAQWADAAGSAGEEAVNGDGNGPRPWPPGTPGSPDGEALVAGLLVTDALAHLAGRPVPSRGHQIAVDLAPPTASLTYHPVLPLPLGHTSSAPPLVTGQAPAAVHAGEEGHEDGMEQVARRLVDGRLGLISSLTRDRPRPGTVTACVSYTAQLSVHPRLTPWVVDTTTGGAALVGHGPSPDEAYTEAPGGGHDRARWAALGEAAERYCANVVPDDLPTASYDDLVHARRPAVDPREFALYSPAQYAQRGFPFVPMTGDLKITWTPGRDLGDGAEVLVPASLTYVNYFRGPRRSEPPTNYPILAGTATGTSLHQAQRAALEEVLERDAVTLWWSSGAPAAPLEVDTRAGPLGAALQEAEDGGLSVRFLRVPSTFQALVAAVFIEDRARRLVAFGSACRASAEEAAAKAFTEAIGMHETGLELADGKGAFWRAVHSGRIDHRPYRAYRKDRRYLKDFRADWRDVNDLRLHPQVYLDPRMQDGRLDRLRTPGGLSPAPSGTVRGVDACLRMLTAQGLRAVMVELTTPDVRSAGLRVVRVMVPGLYCNAPAAFPFLGGERLYREPAAHGWVPGPLTEDRLVRDPLPFS